MKTGNQKGFSLVEMVVTVSLSVFLILLFIYIFSQSNSTSESIVIRQNLLDASNQLVRLLKKDLRSATNTQISSESLKLHVVKLSEQTGLPTENVVEYTFSQGVAQRLEEDQTKTISFASYLKPQDKLSLNIVQGPAPGFEFYLQIHAVNSSGIELIKVYERLMKTATNTKSIEP